MINNYFNFMYQAYLVLMKKRGNPKYGLEGMMRLSGEGGEEREGGGGVLEDNFLLYPIAIN
jgi:hypothetical protein